MSKVFEALAALAAVGTFIVTFLDSEGLLYLGQGAGSCLASVWQSVWHVFNHIGVSLPSS